MKAPTEALKKWLVENCDIKEDATDDEFKKAAGIAMAEDKLADDKYLELTKEPEEDEANEFDKKFAMLAEAISTQKDLLAKLVETKAQKPDEKGATDGKGQEKHTEPTKTEKMVAAMGGTPTGQDGEKDFQVRIKEAAEQYDGTKTALCYGEKTVKGNPHPYAGQPVVDFGEHGSAIDKPSQREMAVIGAWAKFSCEVQRCKSRTLAYQRLNDHDKELLEYALHNMEWAGGYGNHQEKGPTFAISGVKLTPSERKDLIDDPTSGGLEAAPIVFDAAVIQAPLLYGELFPRVNRVTLARGRRVEGVSTGTVTGGWGGIDATAITLFNTASYVAAFNTTIYRWQGSFRIGLDFLSDTPIDFAQHVTQQYGERLLEDLDDVIATGNGTTQPQGVMNSGATAVGWAGATSIGNYESLMFGIHKRELNAAVNASAVFCGTMISYQRAKAIPVGTADARRLFAWGSTTTGRYHDYGLMDRPYAINESLTNSQIFFAVLARYRMYVRRGLTIRTSTEGDTLIRNNEMLIAVTARYGGQMERAAAASLTTTAPA